MYMLMGYIEIQRRRSGDMIDIYLKADESTWYYFSYFRGVMMTQAGNNSYNSIIANTKLNDRKHPESSVRVPYTYMIAVEDRLSRFLRRMAMDNADEEGVIEIAALPLSPSSIKFHIVNSLTINLKPDSCHKFVKSVISCSSRINIQKSGFFIIHNLCNM